MVSPDGYCWKKHEHHHWFRIRLEKCPPLFLTFLYKQVLSAEIGQFKHFLQYVMYVKGVPNYLSSIASNFCKYMHMAWVNSYIVF